MLAAIRIFRALDYLTIMEEYFHFFMNYSLIKTNMTMMTKKVKLAYSSFLETSLLLSHD